MQWLSINIWKCWKFKEKSFEIRTRGCFCFSQNKFQIKPHFHYILVIPFWRYSVNKKMFINLSSYWMTVPSIFHNPKKFTCNCLVKALTNMNIKLPRTTFVNTILSVIHFSSRHPHSRRIVQRLEQIRNSRRGKDGNWYPFLHHQGHVRQRAVSFVLGQGSDGVGKEGGGGTGMLDRQIPPTVNALTAV